MKRSTIQYFEIIKIGENESLHKVSISYLRRKFQPRVLARHQAVTNRTPYFVCTSLISKIQGKAFNTQNSSNLFFKNRKQVNMSSSQNSFTGDFAKLIPRNHIAQLLFSETYTYVEKNDMFHLRFMDCTGNKPLRASEGPVESSTEYDTYHDTDTEGSQVKSNQNVGHFVLSFKTERSAELPHLGWRVGRGTNKAPRNRNVDLLLAKPRDNRSKSLANIHMVFRFNPKSGFLMLRGGSQKASVEHSMSGIWEKLVYEKEQVMYQCSTMLRAGVCEYELEYTVDEKHREAYFTQRDALLRTISPYEGQAFY